MSKICIFGSCVSRDIFRIVTGSYEFNYYARTSLISAVSAPLPINESDIQLGSAFQRKMVVQDFQKDFMESTNQFKPDIVIIDFIDERFDLFKYNNAYVTRTNEFVNGKVETLYTFEQVPRFQESTHELWEQSCEMFVKKLLEVVPEDKIYLHEAYWAEGFLDGDGITLFENQDEILRNNEMLARYYSHFKKLCPGATIVSADRVSDVNHVWGKSPMHFTEDYYKNIYNQLRA